MMCAHGRQEKKRYKTDFDMPCMGYVSPHLRLIIQQLLLMGVPHTLQECFMRNKRIKKRTFRNSSLQPLHLFKVQFLPLLGISS